MDDNLLTEILERLDRDDTLPPPATDAVLAALLDDLVPYLDGATPARPEPKPAPPTEPAVAYVGSITVEGFRGIGARSSLQLQPGPGLTLVVGRNGSGKSSFSEALELAMTGENQRWSAKRSKLWQEGWKNLHFQGGPSIEVQLLIEGTPGPTRIRRSWKADAALADGVTTPSGPSDPLTIDDLGWDQPLATYRPFLSYNELGSMLEEGPSKLFDALAAVLGLDQLTDAAERLRQARLDRDRSGKAARARLTDLRQDLEALDDERARQCQGLLKGTRWKLDDVEKVALGSELRPTGAAAAGSAATSDAVDRAGDHRDPSSLLRALSQLSIDTDAITECAAAVRDAASRVSTLATPEAERAEQTAALLEKALEHYRQHHREEQPADDCPVCGTEQVLDAAWAKRTEEHVAHLHDQAEELRAARRQLEEASAALREIAIEPPAALRAATEVADLPFEGATPAQLLAQWEDWRQAASITDADPLAATPASPENAELFATHLERHAPALAAALSDLRDEAQLHLEQREDAWRPVASGLLAWLPDARAEMAGRELRGSLKAAETWLRETTTELYNERFEPIKSAVQSLWQELRTQSSVDLEDIKFVGRATQRHVELDVTVDGHEGAALGVMSQGELSSLALCLFLPRATLSQSPFRFVFIDDPVQAMDPARVDGLARALDTVARERQVVVFTHDNRLPEAVRRLGIDATLLEVDRKPGSEVAVRPVLDPVERPLEEARALVRTTDLPPEVCERVVPGLCRESLEAACIEAIRRRRLGRGEAHSDVERLVEQSAKLLPRLALALFDDPARAGEVMTALNQKKPRYADLVKACNRGSHEGLRGVDSQFVTDVGRLAQHLRIAT